MDSSEKMTCCQNVKSSLNITVAHSFILLILTTMREGFHVVFFPWYSNLWRYLIAKQWLTLSHASKSAAVQGRFFSKIFSAALSWSRPTWTGLNSFTLVSFYLWNYPIYSWEMTRQLKSFCLWRLSTSYYPIICPLWKLIIFFLTKVLRHILRAYSKSLTNVLLYKYEENLNIEKYVHANTYINRYLKIHQFS